MFLFEISENQFFFIFMNYNLIIFFKQFIIEFFNIKCYISRNKTIKEKYHLIIINKNCCSRISSYFYYSKFKYNCVNASNYPMPYPKAFAPSTPILLSLK